MPLPCQHSIAFASNREISVVSNDKNKQCENRIVLKSLPFHFTSSSTIQSMLLSYIYNFPGGVLSGKVGTGMCGPDRVLFRALRFCNGPFFI